MPTATGTLLRVSANRITAVFDEIQQTFTATLNPPMLPFSSNSVTLTYNDEGDLAGTRHFSGRIGPTSLKLTLNNGSVIEGDLGAPGVSPASMVDGSGSWESL